MTEEVIERVPFPLRTTAHSPLPYLLHETPQMKVKLQHCLQYSTKITAPHLNKRRIGNDTVRYVITKFYRMDSLPNFLTHGAPLARFARESSAIKCVESDDIICPQSENSGLEIECCNLFRA